MTARIQYVTAFLKTGGPSVKLQMWNETLGRPGTFGDVIDPSVNRLLTRDEFLNLYTSDFVVEEEDGF